MTTSQPQTIPTTSKVVPGRVTVITAVYNAASTLASCIKSVLDQDYPDIEHILMDGGSNDGSVDILRGYGNRIVWRSEPDRGIYDAWNKALKIATGEWIAFVGADDYYLPGAISSYMSMEERENVDYISSWVRWVPSSGEGKRLGARWVWPDFQARMTTAHVGSLHRRKLFDRYGQYDLSYRIVGDYELLLRPREALRAAFLPAVTAVMQAGGASDSFAALDEAHRAKVTTGGRNRAIARVEREVAFAKLGLRRILAAIRRESR